MTLGTAPSIFQVGQYLLDLSFENFSLNNTAETHGIQVNVNVEARGLSGQPQTDEIATGDYESMLILNVTARPTLPNGPAQQADGKPDLAAKPIFIIELRYGARYRAENLPVAELEPFLLIEAPRMLFPFARQVASNAVMQGGLPPLLLAPIDFAELYDRQRRKVA